jgi:hypothetical protein
MRFYLGPWVRDLTVPWKRFRPPTGVTWSFDYSEKFVGNTGESLAGMGLFATPDDVFLSGDYVEVCAGDWNTIPDEGMRLTYASLIGVQPADKPAGSTLLEWFASSLILSADVSGETCCLPLMPFGGIYTLCLAGNLFHTLPFDVNKPEAAKQVEMKKQEYMAVKAQVDSGKISDPEFHRRWLDKMGADWRVNNPEDIFIPEGEDKVTRLKHNTTYSETFNKADGALGPVLTWTEYTGTGLAVASNALVSESADTDNKARAEHDTSSSDQFSQFVYSAIDASLFNTAQALGRHSSSTPECYCLAAGYSSGNFQELYRWDSSETEFGPLGSTGSTSISAGNTLRLEVSGSSIVGKLEGVSRASATDTNIASGLRGGVRIVRATSAACTIDDFSFGDLSAGTATGSLLLLGVG